MTAHSMAGIADEYRIGNEFENNRGEDK